MRYVAGAARYDHGIGEPEVANILGVETEVGKKRIAKFQSGVLLNHEIEAGLKAFTFKGLADGVPPETRLSVFDTRDYQRAHKLSDEQRLEIEQILEASEAFGVDYIRVDELHAPKPFPSYDEKTPDEILELVRNAGLDPESVYRYEAENEAREELLAELVDLGAPDTGAPKELEELSLPESDQIFTVRA